MLSTTNITEYVKAAHAGEDAAWTALYQYYYPGLFAVAVQVLNDIDAAKDAVQDSFLIAHLKLNQLKEPAVFNGWIKKILTHVCYRAIQNNQYKYHGSPLKSDIRWDDEFNEKLDRLSAQSSLYAAIAHLPEVLRCTLLLRYFSGFQSYEEIARILSIPVGTVRSRLSQAKLKLTEQWFQSADCDANIFRRSQEWNHFYQTHFSAMHQHDNSKNKLVGHLQKNVQLILPDGKLNIGRLLFEKMIVGDREYGSWLVPTNIISCGNISVVETQHFNSPEYPTHCLPRSVVVLYRKDKEVDKINLHFSSY